MRDDLERFFLEHPMPRLRRDSARIIERKLFREDADGCRKHDGDDVICGCRRR